MKTNIITGIILSLLIMGGCKESIVTIPDLEVSASEPTYKAGKPVTFKLSGNPDIVYFYSGEVGKRYDYAGRVSAAGIPQLQFTSLRANGTQAGSLQLMISTDFPGITIGDSPATIARIAAATWSDITGRGLLSTGSSTNSGVINLSDFVQSGKSVFIAFKYLASAGSAQNKWTISALTLKNSLPDGTSYTLANTTSATVIANYGVSTNYSPGWVFYTVSNVYNWGLSSNNLIITGATTADGATASAEAWTIMGPVDLTKVTPDVGANLKGLDTRLSSYSYTYSTAGTYTATFVGATNNVCGKNELIKQVQITVTP